MGITTNMMSCSCRIGSVIIIMIIIIIISEHLYSTLSFREISSVLDALSVRIEQKAFKITLKQVQGKRFCILHIQQ